MFLCNWNEGEGCVDVFVVCVSEFGFEIEFFLYDDEVCDEMVICYFLILLLLIGLWDCFLNYVLLFYENLFFDFGFFIVVVCVFFFGWYWFSN